MEIDDVPYFELSPELFLDRATGIFGPTYSGKSTIIKNIMIVLKDLIPQVLVVSPSEPSNHSYEGTVPKLLIHYSLADPKDKTKEDPKKFIDALWNRQELMTSIYNAANNVEYLGKLFDRIRIKHKREAVKKIVDANKKKEQMIKDIKHSSLSDGIQAEKIKKINDRFTLFLVKVYKTSIRENIDYLNKMDDLTKEESNSLKHIDFNPRMLLIFDDCAATLKPCFKTPTFNKLLYRGRHVMITTLLVFQDDTDFPPNLRKNIFVSFFTEQKVCRAFFNRTTNNFSKEERKRIDLISPYIYSKRYVNLVYNRDDPTHKYIYKYETYVPAPFRFGSDEIWAFCEQIEAKELSFDKTNPYYKDLVGSE